MAAQSPHAQFVGVDIGWSHSRGYCEKDRFKHMTPVPIATRYPPDNVQFELGDVNTRLRWADRQFDLIHARDILMCVRAFRAFINIVVTSLTIS